MWAIHRRIKKLKVAFQFQYVNQAAWKCDDCRRAGLEQTRRCGYLGREARGGERVVWVRGRHAVTECPKSYITPESVYLLEQFYVVRRYGCRDLWSLPARVVDAYLVLESEETEESARERGRT